MCIGFDYGQSIYKAEVKDKYVKTTRKAEKQTNGVSRFRWIFLTVLHIVYFGRYRPKFAVKEGLKTMSYLDLFTFSCYTHFVLRTNMSKV